MADIITAENLSFSYKKGRPVLNGIGMSVEKRSVFSILGPNGRGKTTLLNLLLGIKKPDSGRLSVMGRAAFVPQLFRTIFSYRVLDMVMMGRARKIGLFSEPTQKDAEICIAALKKFSMESYAERPFHELSGGERQLVILARALVAEAEILVMDEPTSALDLKNQALVLHWIRKLCDEEGLTVVFSTHHPHHALAAADRVMMMTGDGCLCGAPEQVLTEENLFRLYGVPMKKIYFEYNGRSIKTLVPVI